MDASKRAWLVGLYGEKRVGEMEAKIREFGKSMTDEKEIDDGFVAAFKSTLDAIVSQAIGGAPTSWEALDTQRAAADQAGQLASVAEDFDQLLSNIWADPTMTPPQQAAAVAALAAGIGDRLALAAAVKSVARDPATGYLDMICPGLTAATVAGAKSARPRVTVDDYLGLMSAPARKSTKAQADPWLQMLAATAIGGA